MRPLAAAVAWCVVLLPLPGTGSPAAQARTPDTAVGAKANAPRGCGTVTRYGDGVRVSRITAYRKLRCDEARVTVARMIRASRIGRSDFSFGQWRCTMRSGDVVDCDKGQGMTKRMTFRYTDLETIALGTAAGGPPNSDGFGEVEPSRFYWGGVAQGEFSSLRWRDWGSAKAVAYGRGFYSDRCGSACAESVRTRVVAVSRGMCDGKHAYRRARVYWRWEGRWVAGGAVNTCDFFAGS